MKKKTYSTPQDLYVCKKRVYNTYDLNSQNICLDCENNNINFLKDIRLKEEPNNELKLNIPEKDSEMFYYAPNQVLELPGKFSSKELEDNHEKMCYLGSESERSNTSSQIITEKLFDENKSSQNPNLLYFDKIDHPNKNPDKNNSFPPNKKEMNIGISYIPYEEEKVRELDLLTAEANLHIENQQKDNNVIEGKEPEKEIISREAIETENYNHLNNNLLGINFFNPAQNISQSINGDIDILYSCFQNYKKEMEKLISNYNKEKYNTTKLNESFIKNHFGAIESMLGNLKHLSEKKLL